MMLTCVCGLLVLASTSLVHGAINSTAQALNTTDTNLIPNGNGPLLYYNGSGPVPSYDLVSPVPPPITPINSSSALEDMFFTELYAIANTTTFSNNCSQCVAGAELMHIAAITLPVDNFVNILIRICEAVPTVQNSVFADSCAAEYGSVQNTSIPYSSGGGATGAYYAQLFSKMSIATGDMTYYCYFNWNVCPEPPTIGIEESLYFSPKPANASTAPASSGKSINVLHTSDWHLDPRYDIGSEANCSQYLCCRPYATNDDLSTTSANASVPASRFGYLYCDSPPDLALSSFTSMHQFFDLSNVSFAIFTGDILSHDNDDQISREYAEYEETITYQTFKAQLGDIPVYATLGNHDSIPEAWNTQNSLNPGGSTAASANAFGWNYELLSSLWGNSGWINSTEQDYASTHYGAYAHTTAQGLRIISINTDFWYVDNIFNYWNVTNPDTSGILAWLASELAACEARGQRAWIIGHVPSGYDGSNAVLNPSALFYSIVVRFSPATIAGVFFGHTHEDQIQIFYDFLPNSTYTMDGKTYRNTTMVDYSKPLTVGYIGPSITPLTGNNAGYQLYQVDASTFSITGIQTYFANVSEANSWTTPEWRFEYDARATYAVAAAHNSSSGHWPTSAPLNATFWDGVTKSMLTNQTLVELYNLLETKSSVVTEKCSTAACAKQKVCYIRSGSATLGLACGDRSGPF
ncbi:sphingomyelin phosphodiesterase [Fonsecaea erecta]|uniref:Sphingomyelin phosphodiesterase n=1 Tax=Fonsecaea erecta TaxID=1367422 RepID=A0A178ZSZ7_9EURO|nr:sphingomyelin phosphodiesterase [Fonsecaea erecta]OAP62323.1 sphingomyelin phosphodiesterase [Fonsecaea erecta]